jgi:hypothetical protein
MCGPALPAAVIGNGAASEEGGGLVGDGEAVLAESGSSVSNNTQADGR